MEKLIIKYSIIKEPDFSYLYDVYYLDFYNNILSSSLSMQVDEVYDIIDQYKDNSNFESVHFFPKKNVDINKLI